MQAFKVGTFQMKSVYFILIFFLLRFFFQHSQPVKFKESCYFIKKKIFASQTNLKNPPLQTSLAGIQLVILFWNMHLNLALNNAKELRKNQTSKSNSLTLNICYVLESSTFFEEKLELSFSKYMPQLYIKCIFQSWTSR